MKIGILGSGSVAQQLGAGFIVRGHDVMLGTRDPQKLAVWLSADGAAAAVGSFAEAAAFGEMLVLATHGVATVELLESLGEASFAGKIVLDATNPLAFDANGVHLTVGFSDSLGEQIQRAIPSARVVKVFNTVGAEFMVDPQFEGGPPDMFVAGNDDAAKARVAEIVRDFGWNCIDLGGIDASRLLEPLCAVWVLHGMREKKFDHAFKFLRTTRAPGR